MAKKNNKKQPPSWIDTQIQQSGENFLYRINTLMIRKNALRVMKDIATQNVNLSKHAVYFKDRSFVYNICLSAADNQYYTWACYNGLMTSINMMSQDHAVTTKMTQIANELKRAYEAYSLVVQGLNNILNDIQVGGFNVEILLQQLMVSLRPYRYCFNGYFITIGRPDDGYVKHERREIPYGQSRSYSNPGFVQEYADEDYL